MINDLFVFNNSDNKVEINEDVLLIKEFKALASTDRNKCKEDPDGTQLLRMQRELTYIYLMLCWKSPYADYPEADRHKDVMEDAGLTESEFNDPTFRAACRKYRELQESSIPVKLYNSAKNTIYNMIDYFNSVDPMERDIVTGKPIYKVKDIMTEIGNISEMLEQYKALELQVKKEMGGDKEEVLGDARSGTFDD